MDHPQGMNPCQRGRSLTAQQVRTLHYTQVDDTFSATHHTARWWWWEEALGKATLKYSIDFYVFFRPKRSNSTNETKHRTHPHN